MKIESKRTHQIFPFLAITLVYLTELYLYLIDLISAFYFLNILLLTSILCLIFLLVIMRTALPKRAFVFSVILSLLLILYEMPLISLEKYQYSVTRYSAPEELVKGSGIFILSVKVDTVGGVKNEQVLQDGYIDSHIKFYDMTPITNRIRYSSKNTAIFKSMGFYKEEFEQMSANVTAYLKTNSSAIDEFLARDSSNGDSAGLALVLSSLVAQGKLQNDVSIAVTGAFSKTGKVEKVGFIKEKIQIANEDSFSHMMIPLANLAEANEMKKMLHLPIELIGVRDIDEAIQLIKE
ncbi:S16 family serine protease [Sporosarcina sp. NPDC096371]|uniref:S16 family serine protease n=1 Tax=Sporosarcina sp. NPDC096371 TaxID=3364530 RepID=UPI0038042EF5